MKKEKWIILVLVLVFLGLSVTVAVLHHLNNPIRQTEPEVSTSETIPSKAYAEVVVYYDVDLDSPGGAAVPNAVYAYRLDYPVDSGEIHVIGYEQEDSVLHIELTVNGEYVEYSYEMGGIGD